MIKFNPIRNLPEQTALSKSDTIVIFGEVFTRGYVNGIIDLAEELGAKVVYSTVGRREKDNSLRALSKEELAEKNQFPLINIPLEAGFDLDPSSKGVSPCDQISDVKLSAWQDVKIDWEQIEESKNAGQKRFKDALKEYFLELEKHINPEGNVYFVHTMAGGVPELK